MGPSVSGNGIFPFRLAFNVTGRTSKTIWGQLLQQQHFRIRVIGCDFLDFGKRSLVWMWVLYYPVGGERISPICYQICSGKGLVEPKEFEDSCISGNLDLCDPNPWVSSTALDAIFFGDNRGGEIPLVAFDSVGPGCVGFIRRDHLMVGVRLSGHVLCSDRKSQRSFFRALEWWLAEVSGTEGWRVEFSLAYSCRLGTFRNAATGLAGDVAFSDRSGTLAIFFAEESASPDGCRVKFLLNDQVFSISSIMASAAAAGSGALVIGRPTTR